MSYGVKAYQNNSLAALQDRAGARVSNAIQRASANTGVDFSYLMQQANVESSFRPDAKAGTSSATGLYQFIDSTWLSMVNKYGAQHGLGQYAAKIDDQGRVASKADKQAILNLRKDPQIASAMAAEYAKENKSYLEDTVGGEIGSTELYMAHFMGAGGASKFLQAMNHNPNAKGAAMFSDAACSNPSIFYKENGKAKSLSEIYAHFDKKFSLDENPNVTGRTATQVADAAPSQIQGRGDFVGFNENTGKWFKTSNKVFAPTQVAALQSKVGQQYANLGAIPGYQSLVSNPVDIMTLLQYGEDDRKQQQSLWG